MSGFSVSRRLYPRVNLGCPECGVPYGHTSACSLAPGSVLPIRTAATFNAAACSRDCREPATCGWPRCSCPAIAKEAA